MKSIPAFWKKFRKKVQKDGVCLFLDYDGTLTPIIENPSAAVPAPGVVEILRALKKNKKVRVAVVSGRDLAALKKFLPGLGLIFAANHGSVIEGPGIHFLHPAARRFLKKLPAVEKAIRTALRDFPGLRYERKTYGLTLHYRSLTPVQVSAAARILQQTLRPFLRERVFKLQRGKKVWELCPPGNWGKGDAVMLLLKKFKRGKFQKPLPIYIGDDLTDENAFKALQKKGAGIRVVKRPAPGSAAHFYLKSPKEVAAFLKCFL